MVSRDFVSNPNKEGKQPSMRSYMEFTDQHGRGWSAAVEKETLHSTGPLSPMFNVPVVHDGVRNVPLYPPQEYVREVAGPGNIGKVRVNYEKWLEDVETAHKRWKTQLNNYAFAMFGAAAADQLKNPPVELLDAVGPKPFPVELVRACIAGNKWALGIPHPSGAAYPMPDWARPFAPKAEARVASSVGEFPDVDLDGGADADTFEQPQTRVEVQRESAPRRSKKRRPKNKSRRAPARLETSPADGGVHQSWGET